MNTAGSWTGSYWTRPIYFSAGAVCYRNGRPAAYGDQAQMRFIHDLTVLLQQHRRQNPDLCLFEGSHYLYGLVAHGSFTDFEGIPLVVELPQHVDSMLLGRPGDSQCPLQVPHRPELQLPLWARRGADQRLGLRHGPFGNAASSDLRKPSLTSNDAWPKGRRARRSPPSLGLQELLQQGP